MANKFKQLTGDELYTSIAIGIKNLITHQKTLDEINVFPVPDGDTGTNMVFTLMPVVTDLKDQHFERADIAMQTIANTALDSARGNSGTIIAQFYYGLNKAFKGLEIITVSDFARGLQQGYDSAYESLSNPEEGTIITVMRDVAQHALDISNNGCNNYIDFVKPERVYLTHLTGLMDYDKLNAISPKNTEPAFDGLEINII